MNTWKVTFQPPRLVLTTPRLHPSRTVFGLATLSTGRAIAREHLKWMKRSESIQEPHSSGRRLHRAGTPYSRSPLVLHPSPQCTCLSTFPAESLSNGNQPPGRKATGALHLEGAFACRPFNRALAWRRTGVSALSTQMCSVRACICALQTSNRPKKGRFPLARILQFPLHRFLSAALNVLRVAKPWDWKKESGGTEHAK